MADLSETARLLILTLETMGRGDTAQLAKAELEAKNWAATGDDIQHLSTLIQHAASLPCLTPVDGQTDTGEVNEPDAGPPTATDSTPTSDTEEPSWAPTESLSPSAPKLPPPLLFAKREPSLRSELPPPVACLRFMEPFLLSLAGTRHASLDLFESCQRIHCAEGFAELVAAVRHLVVEQLGYEPRNVDELTRLGEQKTLTGLNLIASHMGLAIVATETTYTDIHTTQYNPIFQLHPHAIVFSNCRRRRWTRIVYPQLSGEGHHQFLTLTGPRAGRHPQETSLATAHRLAQLRPRSGESARQLEKRVHKSLNPGAPVRPWGTHGFAHGPPGISWTSLAFEEAKAFVMQRREDRTIHWGLDATLRNRFPLAIARGQGQLSLVEWSVVDSEQWGAPADALVSSRKSRGIGIRLLVDIRSRHDQGEWIYHARASIVAFLPLPDQNGEVVLEGTRYALQFAEQPGAAEAGPLSLEDDGLDDASDFDSTEPEEDGRTADLAHDSEATWSADLWDQPPSTHSLTVLWAYFVERRLGELAALLWKTREAPSCSADLYRAMRRRWPLNGSFQLIAPSLLSRYLRRNSGNEATGTTVAGTNGIPDWACIESSKLGTASSFVPVSAARLGPDGRLVLPTERAQGDWCFADNTETRPTALQRRSSGMEPRSWWIAEHLQLLSGAEPGRHSWPRNFQPAPEHLTAVRVPGDALALLVRAGLKQPGPFLTSRVMVIQDVPNASRQADSPPPSLLVERGQLLRPGEPWASVSSKSWPTSAGSLQLHVVDDALARICNVPPPETDYRLRLAPTESGTVVDAQVTAFPGPLGGTSGWRVALALAKPTQLKFLLPDGRSGDVGVLSPNDACFFPDGELCSALLIDPELKRALCDEANYDTDPTLLDAFSGATGELLPVAQMAEVMVGSAADGPCGPDAHLRVRALDGAGMPASTTSPHLTTQQRQWLAAARPVISDACARAEHEWSRGTAPYIGALQQVHSAAFIAPLRLGPLEWRQIQLERRRNAKTFNPTIRNLPPIAPPLVEWRCGCGALVGSQHAATECVRCGSAVRLLPTKLANVTRDVLDLPVPVLHPWKKRAAGALLGITAEEVSFLADRSDNDDLIALLTKAWGTPFERVARRLQETKRDDVRRDLGLGILDLRAIVQQHASAEEHVPGLAVARSLFLTEIELPPSIRELSGAPAGSGQIQAPSMLSRFRQIELAIRSINQAERLTSDAVRIALIQNLSTSVDDFFGLESSSGQQERAHVSSLRSLYHRLWPTTCPGEIVHTVPGQFIAAPKTPLPCSVRLFADPEPASVSQLDGDNDVLAVVNSLYCLDLPRRPIDRLSATSWREHGAYLRLVGHHQGLLAVWAGATQHLSAGALKELGWPDQASRQLVAPLVLTTLWNNLAVAEATPTALIELLEASADTALPRAFSTALERMRARLSTALPQTDPATKFACGALAHVGVGWLVHPISVTNPLGAAWDVSANDGTRFFPPATSRCWRLLPHHDLFRDPSRHAMYGSPALLDDRLVQIALRLPVAELAESWQALQMQLAAEQKEATASKPASKPPTIPPLTAEPPPQPSLEPEPKRAQSAPAAAPLIEARVFSGSILEWITTAHQVSSPPPESRHE